MTGSEFLTQAQARGLLDAKQAERLRQKLGKSLEQASGKRIAKYLVEKKILSLADAQKILAAGAPTAKTATASAPAAPADEDDFGLAPLEEEGFAPLPSASAPKPTPSPSAKQPKPRPTKPTAPAPATSQPAAPVDTSSLLDELESLESPGLASVDMLSAAGTVPAASPLDALAHDTTATASPLMAETARKRFFGWRGAKEPKKRRKGDNPFDSKLMLFGGGGLLLLTIVGALLLFLYMRGSGDEQFRLAEEDYRGGSYTQAISKYSTFLEKYGSHPKASAAKVRRGLAQLRQAVEQNQDYPHALEVAQKVIPEIENEREFTDARVEFRSLLPAIAEGLATAAALQKTPAAIRENLEAAEEALALVMNTNYVAQSSRPMQRITAIRESMALAQRELDREADLTKTLAAIEAAAKEGTVAQAYQHRRQLLKTYPDLAANPQLVAAIDAVARREQAAIEVTREPRAALNRAAASPVLAAWTLVERRQSATASNTVVPLLIEGAVYGLDSGSGEVLWRYYVGEPGDIAPLNTSDGNRAQVLAADTAHNELVLLQAKSGQPIWRQPVGGQPVGFVRLSNHIVAATGNGQLSVVDLASGNLVAQAKLPQNLRLAPVAHPSGKRFYQIGEQASVYVFTPQLECDQAFYLGHEPGSIRLAPVALSRHLIVAENRGSAAAALIVLKLDEQGKIEGPVQRVEIPGLMVTPPVLTDRQLVAITDRGHAKVLEINPTNLDAPLVEIADLPALAGSEPLTRHLVVDSTNLWIAENRLTRYSVHAAAGRLMPAPLSDDYEDGTYAAAPIVAGELLVHARQSASEPITLVCGTQLSDGKRLWETAVGAPPAGAPAALPNQLAAVGFNGTLFSGLMLNATAKAPRQVIEGNRLKTADPTPLHLESRIELPGGNMVFAPTAKDNRLLSVTWKGPGDRKLLTLPDSLACPPIAWGKGLVVPTAVGQVFWVNPANGKPVAAPFQPEVSAGIAKGWTTPAVSSSGNELVITDGLRVYAVALEREPSPHLAARAESEEFKVPLTSRVAVLNDRAFIADEAGTLQGIDIASLEVAAKGKLAGPAVWGPFTAGSVVLVASAAGGLEGLDGDAQSKWQWQHPSQAIPIGEPLLEKGSAMVAFSDGRVVRFQLADGNAAATAELGQPLATGVITAGGDMATATHDGTVLLFSLKQSGAAAKPNAEGQP